MIEGFDMLAIPFPATEGAEAWLVLAAPAGAELDLDPDACMESGGALPVGWKGRRAVAVAGVLSPPSIQISDELGSPLVRLLETRIYEWGLDACPAGLTVSSPLTD